MMLQYALSKYYDFEMCLLLLDAGADVSDCTR
jgi:hypothetical protein